MAFEGRDKGTRVVIGLLLAPPGPQRSIAAMEYGSSSCHPATLRQLLDGGSAPAVEAVQAASAGVDEPRSEQLSLNPEDTSRAGEFPPPAAMSQPRAGRGIVVSL